MKPSSSQRSFQATLGIEGRGIHRLFEAAALRSQSNDPAAPILRVDVSLEVTAVLELAEQVVDRLLRRPHALGDLSRALARKMDALIEHHIAAEMAGDPDGCVAMYTDDVEHDVVGFPAGALHGTRAAKGFYEQLTADIHTEKMEPTRSYYGDDFCVIEHTWTGTVPGSFLGIPGNGRRISFRLLHIWEFKDGKMSRENVWLDGASAVAQLTA